jgi:hypothetical protein
MIVDVAAFIGEYPYRRLPDCSPAYLLRQMDRLGIGEAWVGHLPSFLYKDPAPGTVALLATLGSDRDRLRPVPTIHPGLPGWQRDLERAGDVAAPAVRVYPMHQSLEPDGATMRDFVLAAGSLELAVILTVRFEDVRQRHPLDTAGDLPPSAVRTLARVDPAVRILVTHAGRAFVEEVHFGLTAEEARRVLWDVSWLWGPPEHELHRLLHTVGNDRFAFGSGMPLRLPEAVPAKLDLTDLSSDQRDAIEGRNVTRWLSRSRR